MKGSLFSVLLFCFVNEGLSSPIPSTMASTTPPPTTTPFTTQIPGCEYDGKIYPPGADIPELRGECYGASCSGDSGLFFIMHWDTFNCGVETSCKYRLCLIVLSCSFNRCCSTYIHKVEDRSSLHYLSKDNL